MVGGLGAWSRPGDAVVCRATVVFRVMQHKESCNDASVANKSRNTGGQSIIDNQYSIEKLSEHHRFHPHPSKVIVTIFLTPRSSRQKRKQL